MDEIRSEFDFHKYDDVNSTGWLCPDIENMYVKNFYTSENYSQNIFTVSYCDDVAI